MRTVTYRCAPKQRLSLIQKTKGSLVKEELPHQLRTRAGDHSSTGTTASVTVELLPRVHQEERALTGQAVLSSSAKLACASP